jgi:hypothetical protein
VKTDAGRALLRQWGGTPTVQAMIEAVEADAAATERRRVLEGLDHLRAYSGHPRLQVGRLVVLADVQDMIVGRKP